MVAVALALLAGGCTRAVTGRGTPGAALPSVGLQHTLCSVITPDEVGTILGLVGPQPPLATFRLRPPAEDGCVISFPTVDVSLSISIDRVSTDDFDQRLDRDSPPRLVVIGVVPRPGLAVITPRSGVTVVDGHLIDVTVDPTHGGNNVSSAVMTRLLTRAVAAFPSVRRLPDVQSEPWCQPGGSEAASLLAGHPGVQRAGLVGGAETCGWATSTSGVIVAEWAHANAAAYVQTALGGHRYNDTVIADDGRAGLVALVDRNHVMTIRYMANGDETVEPQQVYPLVAALRGAMR